MFLSNKKYKALLRKMTEMQYKLDKLLEVITEKKTTDENELAKEIMNEWLSGEKKK